MTRAAERRWLFEPSVRRDGMREYRIVREIETPRMGPNNHRLLEDRINELAKEGWVVHSFVVSHSATVIGPTFTPSAYYSALLERETRAKPSR